MTRARAPLAIAAVGVVWATVVAMWWLTHAPVVATAGAVDAIGTASLVMYLIAVRGGHLPRRALALTVTGGLLLSRFVLASHASVIVLPIALELAAIALVVLRVRTARAMWRASRAAGFDRIDALTETVRGVGLPRVLALELVVLAYAITGWRKPRGDRFTATNGWSLYAGVFAFLVLVETPVLHIALHAWPTAAWIATGLSLYSILWLAGDAHALRHGGIVVGDELRIELGVRWRGRIAWREILSIERGTEAELNAGILGANVVVRFASPQTLRGPLGRARTGTSLALSLDAPDRFVEFVEATRRAWSADRPRPGDAR